MEFFNKLNREFKLGKDEDKIRTEQIKKETAIEDYTETLNVRAKKNEPFQIDVAEIKMEELQQRYDALSADKELTAYLNKTLQYLEIQDEIRKLEKQLKTSGDLDSKLSVEQVRTIAGRKEIEEQALKVIDGELDDMVHKNPGIINLLNEKQALEDEIETLRRKLDKTYDVPEHLN